MYKVQLAAACFAAASQALDLQQAAEINNRPTLLNAQIGAETNDDCCCEAMPCMPTCNNMCDEEEEQVDVEEVNDNLEDEVEDLAEVAGDDIDAIMDTAEDFVNNNVDDADEAEELIEEVIEPAVIEEVLDDIVDNSVPEIVEDVAMDLIGPDLNPL